MVHFKEGGLTPSSLSIVLTRKESGLRRDNPAVPLSDDEISPPLDAFY